MITIRFVSHPGIFNWGTTTFQRFWPDHVDAIMPDGQLLGAHFAGVKMNPPNYDAGTFNQELRLNLRSTDQQEAKFYGFLKAQIGKSYDFRALTAFAFNRDWRQQDSWICSELQAAALEASGVFPQLLAVDVNKVTLRDLCMAVSGLIEVG